MACGRGEHGQGGPGREGDVSARSGGGEERSRPRGQPMHRPHEERPSEGSLARGCWQSKLVHVWTLPHKGKAANRAAVTTSDAMFTPQVPEAAGPSACGAQALGSELSPRGATAFWSTLPSADELPLHVAGSPSPQALQTVLPQDRQPDTALCQIAETGPASKHTRTHKHEHVDIPCTRTRTQRTAHVHTAITHTHVPTCTNTRTYHACAHAHGILHTCTWQSHTHAHVCMNRRLCVSNAPYTCMHTSGTPNTHADTMHTSTHIHTTHIRPHAHTCTFGHMSTHMHT